MWETDGGGRTGWTDRSAQQETRTPFKDVEERLQVAAKQAHPVVHRKNQNLKASRNVSRHPKRWKLESPMC